MVLVPFVRGRVEFNEDVVFKVEAVEEVGAATVVEVVRVLRKQEGELNAAQKRKEDELTTKASGWKKS